MGANAMTRHDPLKIAAKRPAPIAWDIITFALIGALLGTFVGGVFCCYKMATDPTHDFAFHVFADPAVGGVIGALLFGTLAMTRNWIPFR
jgi:threonine/homoserine efflux transporter RhtA